MCSALYIFRVQNHLKSLQGVWEHLCLSVLIKLKQWMVPFVFTIVRKLKKTISWHECIQFAKHLLGQQVWGSSTNCGITLWVQFSKSMWQTSIQTETECLPVSDDTWHHGSHTMQHEFHVKFCKIRFEFGALNRFVWSMCSHFAPCSGVTNLGLQHFEQLVTVVV